MKTIVSLFIRIIHCLVQSRIVKFTGRKEELYATIVRIMYNYYIQGYMQIMRNYYTRRIYDTTARECRRFARGRNDLGSRNSLTSSRDFIEI